MNSIPTQAAPMRLVEAAEQQFAINKDQSNLKAAGSWIAQSGVFPVLTVGETVYALVTGILGAIASPLGFVSSTVRDNVVNPLFVQSQAATQAAMRSLTNTFVRVQSEGPSISEDGLKPAPKTRMEQLKEGLTKLKNNTVQLGKDSMAAIANNPKKSAGAVAGLVTLAAVSYWQKDNISDTLAAGKKLGFCKIVKPVQERIYGLPTCSANDPLLNLFKNTPTASVKNFIEHTSLKQATYCA